MNICLLDQRVAIFIQIHTSNAILTIVLEIAKRARAINLRSDKRRIHLRSGLALVYGRFFSAFDSFQNIRDPLVFIEITEGIQQPPLLKTGSFVGELEIAA